MTTATPSQTKLLVRGEFLLMTRNYGRDAIATVERGIARSSEPSLNSGDSEAQASADLVDMLIHHVDFGLPSLLARPSLAPFRAITALPRRLHSAVHLTNVLGSPSKSGG
ncbi:hypothetical protein NL676_032611 [Syzygium grande]|nr:hypothetical protein NL676_032611 [Syzygium grande]